MLLSATWKLVYSTDMKIALIGKDSPHRRFIINRLLDLGHNVTTCIFYKDTIIPRFDVSSPWIKEEESELLDLYTSTTRYDLDRVDKILSSVTLDFSDQDIHRLLKNVDFVIVSGADRIKGELLELIANKSLNVHMGIAEKYRGLDSNLWAWYHGDYKNIGVSLHRLHNALDTGELFQIGYINITNETKIWELRYHEASLAVELIAKTLKEVMDENNTLKSQKEVGRYYSFMPAVIKQHLPLTPHNYLG